MAQLEIKNFRHPDETREFQGNGKADMVTLAGQTVGRAVFEPGWRWSKNVKPIAGTDRCEVSHMGYCLAGRMRILMADGTQREVGAGDAVAIPPGHDAEVLGDEACVMVDFGEISDYAKRT
ncbi:cupin domain-containing protein [Spirillospora sp. NPDC048911]|uniref:cupin domain-containing protein n=1 Tax=Spirillospora sp. NPDC048911 TaxID=3364527 RepID=UPI0037208E69